jgi:hypothetical protein
MLPERMWLQDDERPIQTATAQRPDFKIQLIIVEGKVIHRAGGKCLLLFLYK